MPKTYRPRKDVDFSETQIVAIQLFLPALLRRYGDVAESGVTELPHPICAHVEAGHCFECPVFGEQARSGKVGGEWLHCETKGFWPEPPACVDDGLESVTCGKNPDAPRKTRGGLPAATTRERAQSWGAEMVARLEGLVR